MLWLATALALTAAPEPAFSARRIEVEVTPVAAHFNSLEISHLGTAATLHYALTDSFALGLGGQYNWKHAMADPCEYRCRWQFTGMLPAGIWVWSATLGFELKPAMGEARFANWGPFPIALLIGSGLGVVSTKEQLKPANESGPATYGDTGRRPALSTVIGLWARVQERVSIRLVVQDLVYSSRVDTVNGCTLGDLEAFDRAIRGGQRLADVTVSRGCNKSSFSPPTDVPLAKNLVATPRAEFFHRATVGASVAVLF